MSRTQYTRSRFIRPLLDKALEQGAVPTPGLLEWNSAGKCEFPVVILTHARKGWSGPIFSKVERDIYMSDLPGVIIRSNETEWTSSVINRDPEYTIRQKVPCRKCAQCLRARTRYWAIRAVEEVRLSQKTWLGSLTLTPEEHFRFLALARLKAAAEGSDFESLPPLEQFARRHIQISKEITKMLKRWRKAGWNIRYFLVVEPHTGKGPDGEQGRNFGLPHYHMLLHDISGDLKWRDLAGDAKKGIPNPWPHGFTDWKLIHKEEQGWQRSVWYVAKYLSKTYAARVRASIGYGGPQDTMPPLAEVSERSEVVNEVNEQTLSGTK